MEIVDNIPEDEGTNDTTDTTEADQDGRAESTLPLTTDVVGLVGKSGWDVAVGTGAGEEDTDVFSSVRWTPSHKAKTEDLKETVGDNDDTAHSVLITEPTTAEHPDTGKDVWWGDEALRCTNAETHTTVENQWQEVGESVGDGGGEAEDKTEAPNLDIETTLEESSHRERFKLDITTISINLADDEVDLRLVQESPGVAMICIWEWNQEPVAKEGDSASDNTFNDKDPSPASESLETVHLHETIGQDTSESGGDATKSVEDSITLAHLIWIPILARALREVDMALRQSKLTSSVPCAEKIDGAREVTSLSNHPAVSIPVYILVVRT